MDISTVAGTQGAALRDAYDLAISRLSHVELELKLLLNAETHIGMLPNEVISMIFLEYYFATEEGHIYSGQWKTLMLVCQRWRLVGLAHSKLWSIIPPNTHPFCTSRILATHLRRSAGSALTCTFLLHEREEERRRNEVAYVLRAHGHRIGSLTLRAPSSLIQLAVDSVNDLPVLHKLHITCQPGDSEQTNIPWILPIPFTELVIPHVRHLRLIGIKFSSYGSLSDLTTLQLENQEGQETSGLPILRDVVDVLARSPRLFRLKLDNIWRENDNDPNTLVIQDTVTLPCLDRIDISGGRHYLCAFVEALHFPPTTSMKFTVEDGHTGLFIRRFMVCLRRLLHRKDVPVFRSIAIYNRLYDTLHISADTAQTCQDHFYTDLDGHYPFFTLASRPMNNSSLRSILTKTLHMLPLETAPVRSLQLSGAWRLLTKSVAMKDWTTICQLVPSVQYVEAYGVENMDVLVLGMTEAMQRGTKGISGRRKRRISKEPPFVPSVLKVSSGKYSYDGTPTPQMHQEYDNLILALQKYRDMNLPGKEAGVAWGTLEFHASGRKEQYADLYDNLQRLQEVTHSVTISGIY